MALWLVRAARHGEHEQRFFEDNRIYMTWDELPENLSHLREKTLTTGSAEDRVSLGIRGIALQLDRTNRSVPVHHVFRRCRGRAAQDQGGIRHW